MKGSRDLLLKLWDPIHISGTSEAKNFKFVIHVNNEKRYRKKFKISERGSGKCHEIYFIKFWDVLHISRMIEGRNVTFGTNIDHPKTLTKKMLNYVEKIVKVARDLLFVCSDPREPLKMETSN